MSIAPQGTVNLDGRALVSAAATAAVVVAVVVPQQVQPGACSHLHQRQRPAPCLRTRQPEGRQQAGAATDLIRLHPAFGDQLQNPAPMLETERAEGRIGAFNRIGLLEEAGIEA